MKPVDDQIMEVLREQGAGTPKSIAEELDRNNDYIGVRCRELTSYGLLDRPSHGFYRLSNGGQDYLDGELDANELEIDEGSS